MKPWLCALLLFGCDDAPTTLLVNLVISDGPTPNSVTISVFDDHRQLVDRRQVSAAGFPGSLLVTGLAPVAERVRVVVRGNQLLGGAAAVTRPHLETALGVALSQMTPDRDGDGIPDSIDDCPDTVNPDQTDSNGDEVGDACAGLDLSASLPDLAGADFAGADLRPLPDLAQAVDLARDAAPGSLCPNGLLLCDGFETGTLDTTLWSPEISNAQDDAGVNGSINVDSSRSYRGSYSLHVHMDRMPAYQYPSAWVTESSKVPQTAIYVRAFVWLAGNATNADVELLFGRNPDYSLWGLGEQSGDHVFVGDGIAPGQGAQSATLLPTDRWVCLQYLMAPEVADMGGGTAVWIDGVQVADLNLPTGWPATPFSSWVMLGLLPQGNVDVMPVDAWFDEVAVDSAPIDCAR